MANSKIINVEMQFWHQGQEFREVHIQRAYEQEEVRAMLEQAGFEDIEVYNGYTLDPPRRKSDRIHFTAIRP